MATPGRPGPGEDEQQAAGRSRRPAAACPVPAGGWARRRAPPRYLSGRRRGVESSRVEPSRAGLGRAAGAKAAPGRGCRFELSAFLGGGQASANERRVHPGGQAAPPSAEESIAALSPPRRGEPSPRVTGGEGRAGSPLPTGGCSVLHGALSAGTTATTYRHLAAAVPVPPVSPPRVTGLRGGAGCLSF